MGREILFSVTRKDLEVSWYTSPGPGGQKKNKTRNACRIRHPESGAMVTAQERREQRANLRAALERLVAHPKFKIWWQRKVHDVLEGETIDQKVERAMRPGFIKTEVLGDSGWVPWEETTHA